MAVPNSRRFVVEGSMPGSERFAFSWAAVGPVVVGAGAQQIADAVVSNASFTGFVTALKPYMSNGTTATTLRCYFYDNAGNLADAGAAAITSGAGSSGTTTPNQCALAVSLRTASSTRSGRGRFYLPCDGKTVDNVTGKISGTNNTLGNAIVALMGYTVAQVASETQGQLRPVTAVRIGDVVDTIRARRSRIQETYLTLAV